MSDEVAIQMLLNQYSVSASRRDWGALVATFAPHAVWEIPSRDCRFEGHEAIRSALVSLTAGTDFVIQQNSPGWIRVDGDRATARSVIAENGKVSGSADGFQALGFYDDVLARTADGWRFEHRTFELASMRSVTFAEPNAHSSS